ncbi:DUF1344 domain-containing protein [Oricola sp.]|uniref:DUF1344 domain-containing protein n=1 Tax=Oricola sp. TaxID=1979950 RepID=UPI0025E4DD47|nr:DUF1344 domain-containing protein [Oricola sp.]MCI5074302.1 DUF1344 domain-containing protein [Oricola sp.]
MNKLVSIALAGAVFAGSAVAALAGTAQGVVESIDPATRTLVLEDGTKWVLGAEIDVEAIEAGDTIEVAFEDGTNMVTALEETAM